MRKTNRKKIFTVSAAVLSILIILVVLGVAIRGAVGAPELTEKPPAAETAETGDTAEKEGTADIAETGKKAEKAESDGKSPEEGKESGSQSESTTDHLIALPSGITIDLSKIPPYEQEANVPVNGNVPFFTDEDLTTESFEIYGDLDALGRCTYAYACVGEDLMPTEKRGSINGIRPSGWQITKYDGIDGNYLYNRCHLIAYGLTGENANERNLITGTRYMNTTGMNDLENETIGYIRRTGNHVLYRVTPCFEGDNLVASGVLMEAQSVEKDDFHFCVYAYNVQPGITIDYATGDSYGEAFTGTDVRNHDRKTASGTDDSGSITDGQNSASAWEFVPPAEDVTYVLNTHSMKFHLPDCSSVREMSPKNREDYTGTREELIEQGYEPCGACRP